MGVANLRNSELNISMFTTGFDCFGTRRRLRGRLNGHDETHQRRAASQAKRDGRFARPRVAALGSQQRTMPAIHGAEAERSRVGVIGVGVIRPAPGPARHGRSASFVRLLPWKYPVRRRSRRWSFRQNTSVSPVPPCPGGSRQT